MTDLRMLMLVDITGELDLQQLLEQSEAGNPDAQIHLAHLYWAGKEVPEDKDRAAEWYRRAADQGHSVAQNNWGVVLAAGSGIPMDKAEARRWLQLAMDQGLPAAEYNLGVLSWEDDRQQAVQRIRSAAEAGVGFAEYAMSNLLASGEDLPKDPSEALKWFQRAAAHNCYVAQIDLAQHYEVGVGGVPEDQQEAARLYRMAADQGIAGAQYLLAKMYEEGRGVLLDEDEAVRLMQASAAQGDEQAQFELGIRHTYGKGVEQDYDKAVEYFRGAAENATPLECLAFGLTRFNREPSDYIQAHVWFSLASRPGAPPRCIERGLEQIQKLIPKMSPEQQVAARAITQAWKRSE